MASEEIWELYLFFFSLVLGKQHILMFHLLFV